MSYVYVFDFGDMVKVGNSNNPAVRIKQLERGNGTKVVRTFAFNADGEAEKIERIIHTALNPYLLQGKEYFRCSFAFARNTAIEIAEQVLNRQVTGVKSRA